MVNSSAHNALAHRHFECEAKKFQVQRFVIHFLILCYTLNGEYKNSSQLRGTFLSSYKKAGTGIYYNFGYYFYT